jgi:outer membrane receptor for ferrienterochelin and colicins
LVWITGIRADHHNQFGWEVTPRTFLKYEVTENTNIRGSIGTGWRTANIFSENIGLLASSRDIIFAESLKPEKALNFGFNATQKYKGTNVEGYFSLDFYRTNFQNQIFPDYDAAPTKAIIKNFTGKSVSNSFQAEVSGTFYNRFSAKLGYVFLDVYQMKGSVKDVLPFNPKHRLNSSASFMPLSKKWHLDANVHWFGKQRLPDTKNNPAIYQMPGQSKPYTIVNTQFTYTLKKFEVYIGAENIFNFRQKKPIISWQEPFGQYFDTQFAWGPTRGREAYLGVRFTIK